MYEALEAEQSVISCLIQRAESVEETYSLLSPEMFDSGLLGRIYFEFRKAFDDHKGLTLIELHQILAADYPDYEIESAFKDCVMQQAMPFQIKGFAEVIQRHYKASSIKAMFDRMELKEADIDDQIDRMIADLEGLRSGETSEGDTIAELAEQFENDYFTDKEKDILFLGIEQLDNLTGGWQGGDVIYFGARPGTGKSAMAMEWAEIFARQGKKVYYYNLEMQKAACFERAVAAKSGIDITRIRRATTFHNDEKELYQNAIAELKNQTGIKIITGGRKVSDIRTDVRNKCPSLVIIDYLQLISCDDRYRGNRVMEVGQISHDIKNIATTFNIPILCLCQLSRSVDGRRDHKPMLSDLRESGDLEQDASIVYFLYNTNENDRSEKMLAIAKSRQGTLGEVPMVFTGSKMHFELAENVAPFGS